MTEQKSSSKLFLRRVIIKGVLLFILIDILFAPLNPLPILGHISAYNLIFPGRVRLPYGEKPDQAYNLSLYNLDAMFNTHELSTGNKFSDEYRVLLIGDSSVWGYLLSPGNTLSADLNAAEIKVNHGWTAHFYDLGYPTLSLTKDLLILSYAMRYKPDLIIWLVTLQSFPVDKQLDSPIVQNNPSRVRDLINTYSLNLNLQDPRFVNPNFIESTLIGQRRALADILRLQIYGVMWAATGIDQYYPTSYEPPQENLDNDETFQGLLPPRLPLSEISMDALYAGSVMAGNVPILFINEPIYISHGENSDIRYNFFYPRWAYDQYRQLLAQTCQQERWNCLDVWNLVQPNEFTNSAIHMSPSGTQILASQIKKTILSLPLP